MSNLLEHQKLSIEETVINGFENLPRAFINLFESGNKNKGKVLISI
jgi:NADPH-dependent curcumin reductase CurA